MVNSRQEYTHPVLRLLLAVAVVALCVTPGILRVPIGAYTFDEPYQMLCGMFPETSPHAPLSAWLTKWFGEASGWRWLSFRYLALGLHALSIVLAGAVLWRVSRRYAFSLAVTAVSLAIGTLIPQTYNIYGWDDWTGLLTVITVIAATGTRRFSPGALTALGLLSGLLVLVRLPNVSIAVIIPLYMWYQNRNRPLGYNLRLTGFYLLVTAVVVLAGLVLMFGSLTGYIDAVRNVPVGDHSAAVIFQSFASFVLPVVLLAVFFDVRRLWLKLLSVALFAVYCWFSRSRIYNHWDVLTGIGVIVYGLSKTYGRYGLKVWIVFLFGCVPLLGSNTGYLKYPVWAFFPLVAAYVGPLLTRRACKIILAVCIAVFVGVAVSLRHTTFNDKGYLDATCRIETGKARGLYTTPTRYAQITEATAIIERYRELGYRVLPLRIGCEFVWEYLAEVRNDYMGSQFNLWNPVLEPDYVRWVENRIGGTSQPTVIMWQKFDGFEETDIPDLELLTLLTERMDRVDETDTFIVFAPRTP